MNNFLFAIVLLLLRACSGGRPDSEHCSSQVFQFYHKRQKDINTKRQKYNRTKTQNTATPKHFSFVTILQSSLFQGPGRESVAWCIPRGYEVTKPPFLCKLGYKWSSVDIGLLLVITQRMLYWKLYWGWGGVGGAIFWHLICPHLTYKLSNFLCHHLRRKGQ